MSIQEADFQEIVWDYYAKNGRNDLPWRILATDNTIDPYKILVSEIMLQQTQVARVIPKFEEFMQIFPSVQVLAASDLGAVLRAWQGLGYNRRAKYLWEAAGVIVNNYDGLIPESVSELIKLPGVGVNTAGAITVYSWDKPEVFVETNMNGVYTSFL